MGALADMDIPQATPPPPSHRGEEKWEVLPGIRLLEPLFGVGCQTIRLPLHRRIWLGKIRGGGSVCGERVSDQGACAAHRSCPRRTRPSTASRSCSREATSRDRRPLKSSERKTSPRRHSTLSPDQWPDYVQHVITCADPNDMLAYFTQKSRTKAHVT